MLIDCKACDCTAIAGDLERCPECGADLTASAKPEAAPKRPALAAAAPPKDAA